MASTASAQRRIEYQPLKRIKGAARNPKSHDLVALAGSMDRFGYVEPIVVDERTGRLVAGHGRLAQLRALQRDGVEPPDGVTKDANGEWTVPVIRGWRSKDDAEAEGYLLASNRITELGGWDNATLAEILGDLESSLRDVAGFSEADLDLILAEQAARLGSPTQADEAWVGMPPLDNDNLKSAYTVTIHFPSDEYADEFFKTVLERTKTRSMWWPHDDGFIGTDAQERVVADVASE